MELASAINIKEFYKEIYLYNPIFTCTFMVIIRRPPVFDRDWWVCDSSVDGVFQLTCRCLSEALFGVGGGADEFRFLFNELVDWSVSWANFCCRWSCCLVFDSTDSCPLWSLLNDEQRRAFCVNRCILRNLKCWVKFTCEFWPEFFF